MENIKNTNFELNYINYIAWMKNKIRILFIEDNNKLISEILKVLIIKYLRSLIYYYKICF